MRFLVDAQLPPALTDNLVQRGHFAEHVNLIGMGEATDEQIWAYARTHSAVIMTKDQDFADLAHNDAGSGRAVVWIRLGNTTRAALWRALEPLLPEIIEGLERGEHLIEIVA